MSNPVENAFSVPTVRVKKLRPAAIIPAYQSAGASGMDLHADLEGAEKVVLRPGERMIVKTGLAFAIPAGFEMQVRPRSGLAAKNGITVVNAPGTVDNDYRGEVMVILLNTNPPAHRGYTDHDLIIKQGDRIAQVVIAPVVQASVLEVEDLDETVRGANGFGSTGS